MSSDNTTSESLFHDSGGSDRAQEIAAHYADRLIAGEKIDADEVLSAHPTAGPEVLQHLEVFVGVGSNGADCPLGTLGDYTLRRQIGRGGMGVVYEAWQNSMNRQVALKVLPAGIAADQRACARFMREAQTAGQLNHENVVRVYSTGAEEGTPWYSMEFVEGETLAQILARIKDTKSETETPFGKKGELAFYSNLASAFADVADGLQHAHSKGVTHRDIKPSNLILDAEGRLRILDFGLARLEGQESLTLSGDFVGTPLYMSPEQARRKKIQVDHRTDVYSLGATMYEAICGRPPFRGKDHADTLSQIIDRDVVEPKKVNPRVPRDLETIVLKCLRKEAGNRYGTAEALSQDLRRFVRGDPIEARPMGHFEQLVMRIRRHQVRIALALCAVSVAFVLVWLGFEYRAAARDKALKKYRADVGGAAERVDLAELRHWLESSSRDRYVESDDTWLYAVDDSLIAMNEEFPDLPDADYHRARALLYGRRTADALSVLQSMRKRFPRFAPALLLESEVRRYQGDDASARELLNEAEQVARDPRTPWQADLIAGRQALRERRFGDAVKHFDALISRRELDTRGFIGLSVLARTSCARARIETDDLWGAMQDLVIATHDSRGALDAALLFGKVIYLLGHPDDAERYFRRVHDSTGLRDAVAVAISQLWMSLGEGKRSVNWLDEIDESAIRERRLVEALHDTGQLEKAEKEARRALADDPSAVGVINRLAYFLGSLNRHREATELVADAVKRLPDEPTLLFRLSLLCYEYCFVGEGVRLARRAMELGHRGAYSPLSRNLMWNGARDEAFEVLADEIRLRPFDASAHFRRGLASSHLRRYEEALEPHRRAIELGAGGWAHYWLGDALLALGHFKQAEKALRLARDTYPVDERAASKHAVALAGLDRHDEAVEALCDGLELFPESGEQLGLAYGYLEKNADRISDEVYDRLLRVLTARFEAQPGDSKNVHRLWGALYWHPKGQDLEAAHAVITRALELGDPSDPTVVARLAETEWGGGERARAVEILERAVRMPGRSSISPLSPAGRLERWRRAVWPDLPTFTSIDAELERRRYDTVLPETEAWRFRGGRKPPPVGLGWTQPAFDDSDWEEGAGSFGYGDEEHGTEIDDMRGAYTSVFIRRELELDDSEVDGRFFLNLRVDDGCVAFLNGKEIGRVRVAAGPVSAETTANDYSLKPLRTETIEIETGVLGPGVLGRGRNVIAILGVNYHLADGSFTLAPSLARELKNLTEAWRDVLESFRKVATGDDADSRVAYLEARILEAGGQYHEAVARLRPIARETPGELTVLLALARCLELAGDREAASIALQRGIVYAWKNGRSADREVVEAWLRLDLNRSPPAEILAMLPPADGRDTIEDPLADPPPTTFANDVRWLLERLAVGDTLRINVGGSAFVDGEGHAWTHDRFAVAGRTKPLPGHSFVPYFGLLHGGERRDALFRKQRFFSSTSTRSSYRIPLPAGRYRVSLAFAELIVSKAGLHVFEVVIEGETRIESLDLSGESGYATAVEETFEVEVKDAALDIGIVPRKGWASLAGIEIERLP